MSTLFGTDGIRGVAGEPPLDRATIFRIGRCLALQGCRSVVVGRDTRESGPWMEEALSRGLTAAGARVTSAGVLPTPAVSVLCRDSEFDAGVVVSASHNVYSDNGLKIFTERGRKLSRRRELALETLVAADDATSAAPPPPRSSPPALIRTDPACLGRYSRFLRSALEVKSLEPLKLVLDCASGAASQVAPQIFSSLGARVAFIDTPPDGRNINRDCGAVYPRRMARAVGETRADFGAAFDGDADRVILADHRGRILTGDHILYVLARHLLERNRLPTRRVVATVMSNSGLEAALGALDVSLVRTPVGDRNVLESMVEGGDALGGEPSGHIILGAHSRAGDGILTTLKMAQVLLRERRSLARLSAGLRLRPQVLRSVIVGRRGQDLLDDRKVRGRIESVQESLQGRGRVLVRCSGTEPVVRIMVEGEDREHLEECVEGIAAQIRSSLKRLAATSGARRRERS